MHFHSTRSLKQIPSFLTLGWMFLFLTWNGTLLGCGQGGGPTTSGPGDPPTILIQPASTEVPWGRPATFSVSATGTTSLAYQWFRNGLTIAGATLNSYSTATVTDADDKAVYTVSVSDLYGTTKSASAILTVGARAPMQGDLRFQQVASDFTRNGYTPFISTLLTVRSGEGYTNSSGTPLGLGYGTCGSGTTDAYGCSWPISSFSLPQGASGLTMIYRVYGSTVFNTQMNAVLADSNNVITSLDIQQPQNAFAYSVAQQASGAPFIGSLRVSTPAQIDNDAANEGASGRVITAIALAGTQLQYLSYSWQNDTSTTYETKISKVAAVADIGAAATNLANEGYIITAFGGTAGDFYLVGTRVRGDVKARSMLIQSGTARSAFYQGGYAVVASFTDNAANQYWIGEK